MTVVMLGIVAAGLYIIERWDEPLQLSKCNYVAILAGAILQVCIITYFMPEKSIAACLLLSVIGGCLLLASVTDLILCQVYNFVWWIGLAAALALLWSNRQTTITMEALQPLLLFLILQLLFFRRVYGRADCYAFCVCAVAEAALGMKMAAFLTHMLIAYVLLFLVQVVRRNINKRGNLKQPVPFLPYITIAFWINYAVFLIAYASFG